MKKTLNMTVLRNLAAAAGLLTAASFAAAQFGPLPRQAPPEDPGVRIVDPRVKANAGDAEAQYNLAGKLEFGYTPDGKPDYKGAMEWLAKAAAQGHRQAQYRLGEYYSNGRVVPADEAKVVYWWTKAAEGGHVQAQYMLGGMYEGGVGVQRDARKAFEWWSKSAAQGEVVSMDRLGLLYALGNGVERDPAKAIELFTRSARKDFNEAQVHLALAYAQGFGVEQDFPKAYAWFSLAADHDSQPAAKALPGVAAKMTPAQIAQGKALATALRADLDRGK